MDKKEHKQVYYVPETPKVDPLALNQNEIKLDDTLKSIVNENGLIKTELETDVVLSRIAKDIYKNYLAGFRETYANAVTACQSAAETFKSTPTIEVTLDKDMRMLRIKEIDSMGVSPEAFKDIYRVVGRTGNADGKRLGQFGFGRLAWVALSDRMIFETKYRTVDGRTGSYALENKEGLAFAPLRAPDIDDFGTTLSFFLYENLDLSRLESYIKTAGQLVPIKTTLKVISDGKEIVTPLTMTPESILDANIKKNTHNDTKILSTEMLTYKDSEVEVYGKLAVGKYSWTSADTEWEQYRDHLYAYADYRLLGMPIDQDRSSGPFTALLVNILDERKFQPTADRDRLREDTAQALSEKLVQVFRNMLVQRLSMSTLTDYMALPKEWKIIFDVYARNFTIMGDHPIIQMITTEVSTRGMSERWKIPLGRMLNLIPKERLFFSLNGTPGHYLPKVQSIVPNAVAVIIHDEETAKALRDYGVRDLKEFGKGKKVASVEPIDYVIYQSNNYTARKRASKQELPETTIKIPDGRLLEEYIRRIGRFRHDYVVTRDMKHLDGIGIGLAAFMRKVGTKIVTTSEGPMAVKDIPKDMYPMLCVYDMPDTAQLMFKGKTAADLSLGEPWESNNNTPVIGILADANTIFEVMFYFEERRRQFELDTEGSIISRAYFGDNWYSRGNFYEHNLSILHVYLMCKDKELAGLFQIAMGDANNYEEMVKRRTKVLDTLAHLDKS